MPKQTKPKQIVIRFDQESYEKIREHAEIEHRGMGEFIRHTALVYIEHFKKQQEKKK